MKDQAINLYILNNNVEIAGKLRKYLLKRFGNLLNISLFFSSGSCLRMMDDRVDLVVVDDYLHATGGSTASGVEVLKRIKAKNPNTDVIILTSHEDIASAVDAMRNGARDYISNQRGAWQRIQAIIEQVIKQPIRFFVAEYGINTFVLVFMVTFLTMGIAVFFTLRYWN